MLGAPEGETSALGRNFSKVNLIMQKIIFYTVAFAIVVLFIPVIIANIAASYCATVIAAILAPLHHLRKPLERPDEEIWAAIEVSTCAIRVLKDILSNLTNDEE